MTRPIRVPGFRIKNAKLEKIPGFKLNASAAIKQRKSKRQRVVRRAPG
jgi:hypothetical protein